MAPGLKERLAIALYRQDYSNPADEWECAPEHLRERYRTMVSTVLDESALQVIERKGSVSTGRPADVVRTIGELVQLPAGCALVASDGSVLIVMDGLFCLRGTGIIAKSKAADCLPATIIHRT